jgi:hypothetical protein
MVLDGIDGLSSPAASMFMVAGLLEGRANTAAANGVHWGPRSTLVAALMHFPALKSELGSLRSGHNANLAEDEADAL